jgi:hypothetical protein
MNFSKHTYNSLDKCWFLARRYNKHIFIIKIKIKKIILDKIFYDNLFLYI